MSKKAVYDPNMPHVSVEIYKDRAGKFRFRILDNESGHIISMSPLGYPRVIGLIQDLELLFNAGIESSRAKNTRLIVRGSGLAVDVHRVSN